MGKISLNVTTKPFSFTVRRAVGENGVALLCSISPVVPHRKGFKSFFRRRGLSNFELLFSREEKEHVFVFCHTACHHKQNSLETLRTLSGQTGLARFGHGGRAGFFFSLLKPDPSRNGANCGVVWWWG